MDKTGFVVKVMSKGKEYFYLRKSFWEDNRPKNRNIFSFGSREKAIENLSEWKINKDKFPKELINLGYDIEDIPSWLEDIKSK